jgi:hypothetical protein
VSDPSFPNFKQLEMQDRGSIDRVTALFPPFSDFSFVSLVSWNIRDQIEWSLLRDNLIVRFGGYLPGQPPFFSLIGTNDLDATIRELLDLAGASSDAALRLVPQVVVDDIVDPRHYRIKEDPDNHDYVFLASDVAECRGARFEPKRKRINRFVRAHGDDANVDDLDLSDTRTKLELREVFLAWERERGLDRGFTGEEHRAITNMLENATKLNLTSVGVSIGGRLRAFSICELRDDGFAIAHFEKADVSYPGLFQYLKQQVAARLRDQGCEFINYEQDLGLPGIRREKRSWHPVTYLKKYVVTGAGR